MKVFQLGLIGLILFALIATYPIMYWQSGQYVEFTVQEKTVKNTEESSYYLIYSEEGEVFKNVDGLFHGKFNSSDIYGQLKVGHKYHAKVYGWRMPFWSAYRNIITVKEVK